MLAVLPAKGDGSGRWDMVQDRQMEQQEESSPRKHVGKQHDPTAAQEEQPGMRGAHHNPEGLQKST